jgi:hypothetical protein
MSSIDFDSSDNKLKRSVRRSTKEKADSFKQKRINNGGDFIWKKKGNVYIYESNNLHNEYMTNEMYKGIHIVSMVKVSLRKKVNSGALIVPKICDIEARRKIVFFNKTNVLKHNGCGVVAVDFSRCYWVTLYLLGYINKSLYDKGMSNYEYKLACNLSVGSLGMKERVEVYKQGKLVNEYEIPSGLEGIRLHVISRVYKVCMEIINSSWDCKDGFLWFLTDCFFVKKGSEQFFIDKIKEYGYDCKTESHEKYTVNTEFRISGDFKYNIKWDSWGVGQDFQDSYKFSRKNDVKLINEKS